MRVQVHGANPVDPGTAITRPAPTDGVFPDDFYSTTNLDTFVRLDREWLRVDRPEMDCGLVVEERDGGTVVRTVPVSDVRAGEPVVCGAHGVRVELPPPAPRGEEEDFGFMSSTVSSEKPQALLVRQIAERMREVKDGRAADPLGRRPGGGAHRRRAGDGPAGATPATSTSCSPATRWPRTTSSPRSSARRSASTWPRARACRTGTSTTSGRSTRSAPPARSPRPWSPGVLTGGVMHAMVRAGKPFVLVGSVRDDGPLPDVYTDVIEGQRAMRAELPGRRLRDHGGDDAALDRDREHPAGVGARW